VGAVLSSQKFPRAQKWFTPKKRKARQKRGAERLDNATFRMMDGYEKAFDSFSNQRLWF